MLPYIAYMDPMGITKMFCSIICWDFWCLQTHSTRILQGLGLEHQPPKRWNNAWSVIPTVVFCCDFMLTSGMLLGNVASKWLMWIFGQKWTIFFWISQVLVWALPVKPHRSGPSEQMWWAGCFQVAPSVPTVPHCLDILIASKVPQNT